MQIRPLRYWRREGKLPSHTGQSTVAYGSRVYYTSDDLFIIHVVSNQWRIAPCLCNETLLKAGNDIHIFSALFPRRRDAVEALEAIVAAQ